MIGLQGLGVTSGSVVDVKSKTLLGSMSEWIQERYGIYVSGGVLTYVTPDAKSVFGYTLEIQENGQPYLLVYSASVELMEGSRKEVCMFAVGLACTGRTDLFFCRSEGLRILCARVIAAACFRRIY